MERKWEEWSLVRYFYVWTDLFLSENLTQKYIFIFYYLKGERYIFRFKVTFLIFLKGNETSYDNSIMEISTKHCLEIC